MCNRPDCPNPEKAKHLHHKDEFASNPLFDGGTDMMPDGFHAKPMRLWRNRQHKIRVSATMGAEQIAARRQELQAEYDALPDPKQPLFRWLAMRTEGERFWSLYGTLMSAPMYGDQVKANALISEYGTARPKQELEITGSDLSKEDNLGLLRKVLELNKIDPKMAEALLQMAGKESS